MKIALYYPWIYLKSGVERTIYQIVTHSQHEYTLFTNHYDPQGTFPEFKNLDVRELKKVPVKRDLFSVARAAFIIATQKINLDEYDALFVHSDGLGDLITCRNRELPLICYCHTPLRPVFDPFYRHQALIKTSYVLIPFFLFASFLFYQIDRYLWQRYRWVIFNSQETFDRAERGNLLPVKKANTSVLHPGIDLSQLSPSWTYLPYFLLPGRIMWTKNIELGIRSFIHFKKRSPTSKDFVLIIAGQVDTKSQKYLKRLQHLARGRNDIKFVIDPSDTVLKKYYRHCWAVLSCSFNEDWGLTILEANAYGKAVVAVNQGGPKESIKPYITGFLAQPSISSFSFHLNQLAQNKALTIKLGKQSYRYVQKYDISKFVRKFDQLLATHTKPPLA